MGYVPHTCVHPCSCTLKPATPCRLQFHNVCAEKLTLTEDCAYPYHFCALSGNMALAFFFYVHGVPAASTVHVASFKGSGPSGDSFWSSRLGLPPDGVAMMAGVLYKLPFNCVHMHVLLWFARNCITTHDKL